MMQTSRSASQRRLVLNIEDNADNRALLEELLDRRADLTLISANTGAEGLALASVRQPDVILMDINLPDMSGLDALKSLRAHAATAHIPVMALSSNAFPLQIKQGIEAGFCQYLTKPFKITEFLHALDQCLEVAQARAHLAQETPAAGSAPC